MAIIAFDIEADGLLIDAQNIWCICAEDVDTHETWSFHGDNLHEAVDLLESADAVVGHNCVMYDRPVMHRLLGGFKPKKMVDTQLMSRLIWPCRYLSKIKDHSLAYWGKVLGFPKIEHNDFTQLTDEMLTYCANDVHLTVLVYQYQKMRWGGWEKAAGLEHRVAEIVVSQLENGMTINHAKALELKTITTAAYEEVRGELEAAFEPRIKVMKRPSYYECKEAKLVAPTKGELRQKLKEAGYRSSLCAITEGPPEQRSIPFNPGSGPDIIKGFKDKYNWKPKVFTKDDKGRPTTTPCTDGDVLASLPYPEAELILEYRLNKARATSAETWIECVSPITGRLHHSVRTNGAVTGRMAHSDPNINVPKVKADKSGPILGRAGEFGWECRSCFEPRPGWWQVGADASGLELRMLAHFMAEFDGGEYARALLDGDIHTHNMKAAGLSSRDQAKTFIYGFLYGAGAAKIGKIVGGTAEDGDALKTRFLRGLPALARLKDSLDRQVKKFGYLIGLDGRKVPTRATHSILNTHLQGGGAILMKFGTCFRHNYIVDALGPDNIGRWGNLAMIHDEWQAEAKKKQDAETIGQLSVKALRRAGEYLALRCPIDGEFKVGKNWAECH
jgi:hypothetical protein